MLIRRNQYGDTIIEVLLAITIMSAVLGATYVTAQRSLHAGRRAQERGEALKIAETQIEKVRSYVIRQEAAGNDNPLPNERYLFCMDITSPVPTIVGGDGAHAEYTMSGAFGGQPVASLASDSGFTSFFHDTDSFGSAGVTVPGQCLSDRYKTVSSVRNDTLNVLVRWDRIGGGIDQVTMVYRANGN